MAALGFCLLALSGCQILSNTNSTARVRIIDVSPDAPAVDVYQGETAVAYNLSFGTVTSYLPVSSGAETLTVNLAGSRQVLSSVEGSFAANAHYTVLVSRSIANLQQTVLQDREQVPLPGSRPITTTALRIIHQAGQSGALDIYLVPAGQKLGSVAPVITNLPSGSMAGYLAVPACTCAVMMLPAGTLPASAARAVHSGAQITFSGSSARTLILLDAQPAASSGVQMITTIDAEPSS